MDFKALEYICAISEAKTISQAAKNLFISQPALSQFLSKLERELGTPIFDRSGNMMTLTSAGEILVRDGSKLLLSRNEMLHRVAELSDERAETLRFGVSPFYSKYYLPLLFPYYREHHPNIRLDIVEKKLFGAGTACTGRRTGPLLYSCRTHARGFEIPAYLYGRNHDRHSALSPFEYARCFFPLRAVFGFGVAPKRTFCGANSFSKIFHYVSADSPAFLFIT